MTVTVVPILRLRRATRGWSYKVPSNLSLQVGALVIIPFRNRPALGVVWDTDESSKATLSITEALTTTPLVRAPHRQLIEWLAEAGICSLSTALYTWLPSALRAFPLTKSVRQTLSTWDKIQPSASALAQHKQHLVLTPSHRPSAEAALASKYHTTFHSTFDDATPAQEFITWTAIATGSLTVVTGRERALYAPWLNLRHITVIDPEDISYHTGQSPYVCLTQGAKQLAGETKANLTYRTHIPLAAAQMIWPESVGTVPTTQAELTDLRHERILNPRLLAAIQKTVVENKSVILLHNAHDRIYTTTAGERVILPGIETLTRQLAAALATETLPPLIRLGTRSILTDLPRKSGFAAILSLDPLLNTLSFFDKLQGWADVGRLASLGIPLVVQTRDPGHPLAQALAKGTLTTYCVEQVKEAEQAHIPPFCEEIVCAIAETDESMIAAAALVKELQPLTPPPWMIGYARSANRRGAPVIIVTLTAPLGIRLPAVLRRFLSSLTRPWKVERGPWYAS